MTPTTTSKRLGELAAIACLWLLTCFEAAGMAFVGAQKLMLRPRFGAAFWEAWFTQWGYPHWFLVAIAVLEICGGLLLLIPRVAPFAALLLICVMLGAAGTTVIHAHDILAPGLKATDFTPVPPLFHVALLGIILFARRRGLRF